MVDANAAISDASPACDRSASQIASNGRNYLTEDDIEIFERVMFADIGALPGAE